VEMTLLDVSDRPIEYFKTAYRADRFTRRSALLRVDYKLERAEAPSKPPHSR
jgi:hypothetical protein